MTQNKLLKIAAIVTALFLWQAAALILNQKVLFVGPIEVLQAFIVQLISASFWATVWFSLWRVFFGFVLAFLAGIALAALSHMFLSFRVMLWPYISVIKSTPVASVIILILIFLNSRSLSIIISFLIVMPVVYANILEGLANTDKKLLEMAEVYDVGLIKRIKYIYLPQLHPYIISTCTASIGMAWKSGSAAEVIGIPKGSIGERLYQAKIYLNTSELFAWTAIIILLSMIVEKITLWVINSFYRALWRS